ncbi:hypothetical protein ACFOWM_06250 [Ferruginibacter yonginensis]|uniref:Uncharacterized protein n=1 Tax=Ferruginibacter yonginensis TaxID=1310416 RepID=A0ABV8QSW7_9BACT
MKSKILLMLLCSIMVLFGCASTKPTYLPASTEKTSTVVKEKKDTTLHLPADTSSAKAKLVINEAGKISLQNLHVNQIANNAFDIVNETQQTTAAAAKNNTSVSSKSKYQKPDNKRALPPELMIDDSNNLYVNCYCDTGAILLTYEQTHQYDNTVITQAPKEVIIEKPFTGWQNFQLWCGRIFILLLLILIAVIAIRAYNIFKQKKLQ